MRRTRTNNVTHTEKLARLRSELISGLELAQMVVEREKLKQESARVNQTIWKSRESLVEYMKVLTNSAPGSVPPADEQLLFDKERKLRRRAETTGHRYVTSRLNFDMLKSDTFSVASFSLLDADFPMFASRWILTLRCL